MGRGYNAVGQGCPQERRDTRTDTVAILCFLVRYACKSAETAFPAMI